MRYNVKFSNIGFRGCRYDVELYQRIEHLIGKKLPQYPTVEDQAMVLSERVGEAQRYAKVVNIKEMAESGDNFLFILVFIWFLFIF